MSSAKTPANKPKTVTRAFLNWFTVGSNDKKAVQLSFELSPAFAPVKGSNICHCE
jgi:hypothetical protein